MPRKSPKPRANIPPEKLAKLKQALAAGNYLDASCLYAGVCLQTADRFVRNYQSNPDSLTPSQRATAQEIHEAMNSAEIRIVAQWQQHMPKNWLACAAFLERRSPERWARHRLLDPSNTINIGLSQSLSIDKNALVALASSLTPEQEQRLLSEFNPNPLPASISSSPPPLVPIINSPNV